MPCERPRPTEPYLPIDPLYFVLDELDGADGQQAVACLVRMAQAELSLEKKKKLGKTGVVVWFKGRGKDDEEAQGAAASAEAGYLCLQ